eukprot:8770060-Prorocentrum_lima.AAC.1
MTPDASRSRCTTCCSCIEYVDDTGDIEDNIRVPIACDEDMHVDADVLVYTDMHVYPDLPADEGKPGGDD